MQLLVSNLTFKPPRGSYSLYTTITLIKCSYPTSSCFGGGTRDEHFSSLFTILCDGGYSESVRGVWGELGEGHSVGGRSHHSIFVKHNQRLLRAGPLDACKIRNLWNGNLRIIMIPGIIWISIPFCWPGIHLLERKVEEGSPTLVW